MTRQDRWRKRNPWVKLLIDARQRCNNPNNRDYKQYGGTGLLCTLTPSEIKKIWDHDEASKLKRPSLDRKDSRLGYVYSNCRIIEFDENRRRALYGD